MERSARILVTGARGLVGRALVGSLRADHDAVVAPARADCDLEDRAATHALFRRERPQYVFHLAARVGGIAANIADPVGFLQANMLINVHVLEACHQHGVHKTLVLGSSCIYPRECPQPMKEEFLLTGPLEPTNEGYALAKLLGLKLARAYHRQHGMKVVCPVPCNIYGPGDSFDLERSHVLSALVRRFMDARRSGAAQVQLWGTGAARREFIHVADVVRAMRFFMEQVETAEPVNVGPGEDLTIRELATRVAELTGFTGRISWDPARPDGMPRKCLDVTRARALGFATLVALSDGIREVMADYQARGGPG